jgi:hypothetical protein
MKRMDQTGHAGPQPSEMHLRFAAGRVTGSAVVPQLSSQPEEVTIDTALAAGPCYTEFASNLIVRALPLRPGATFSFPVLSVGDRSIKTLTVQVAGVDSVSVPAGTFRAFKVDVSGGGVSYVYYVSERAPRRVLKVEIVGTPVAFELVR